MRAERGAGRAGSERELGGGILEQGAPSGGSVSPQGPAGCGDGAVGTRGAPEPRVPPAEPQQAGRPIPMDMATVSSMGSTEPDPELAVCEGCRLPLLLTELPSFLVYETPTGHGRNTFS